MRSPLLILTSLAAGTLAAPLAECTREALTAATDALLAAHAAGSADGLTTAADVAYTENFKTAQLATGILSRPLAINHSRSDLDTTQCATYTEVIVTDAAHPYVIGTQLRLDAAAATITRIDAIVTDQGDWLFNATGTAYWAAREAWTEIPEADRDSRATIQAAGDAYADLFNDKSVQVPWGTPCARLEGGSYTGRGLPSDSCNVGVPSGVALVNRRYVIDEVFGVVDIFMNFGGPQGIPDSHEFRVEKGKLRYVHTLSVMGQ